MINVPQILSRLDRRVARRLASRPPPIVYHYTSQAGLLGIVQSRALWCTDLRYLNDSREYRLALDLAFTQLKREAAAGTPTEREFFLRCTRMLSYVDQYRCYAACFSEDGDMLSQWRAYAGVSGYAIGIPSAVLQTARVEGWDLTQWVPCVYDARAQVRHIRALIRALLEEYLQIRRRRGSSKREALLTVPRILPGRLSLLAACLKDPGFREEREWRLVVWDPIWTQRPLPLQFRPGGRTLVPYLQYPLSRAKLRLPIRKIVVGPSPHLDPARDALRSFLDENGLKTTRIVASRVPYRDW